MTNFKKNIVIISIISDSRFETVELLFENSNSEKLLLQLAIDLSDIAKAFLTLSKKKP